MGTFVGYVTRWAQPRTLGCQRVARCRMTKNHLGLVRDLLLIAISFCKLIVVLHEVVNLVSNYHRHEHEKLQGSH